MSDPSPTTEPDPVVEQPVPPVDPGEDQTSTSSQPTTSHGDPAPDPGTTTAGDHIIYRSARA